MSILGLESTEHVMSLTIVQICLQHFSRLLSKKVKGWWHIQIKQTLAKSLAISGRVLEDEQACRNQIMFKEIHPSSSLKFFFFPPGAKIQRDAFRGLRASPMLPQQSATVTLATEMKVTIRTELQELWSQVRAAITRLDIVASHTSHESHVCCPSVSFIVFGSVAALATLHHPQRRTSSESYVSYVS